MTTRTVFNITTGWGGICEGIVQHLETSGANGSITSQHAEHFYREAGLTGSVLLAVLDDDTTSPGLFLYRVTNVGISVEHARDLA